MKLSVPFSEISDIIKAKVGKDVTLACVDEKTFSASVNLFLLSPKVKVTVVGMRGDDLCLRLGDLMNIISSWLSNAQKYYTVTDDGMILVHLDKIDKLEDALEKISIESITFDNNGANVMFHLKQF